MLHYRTFLLAGEALAFCIGMRLQPSVVRESVSVVKADYHKQLCWLVSWSYHAEAQRMLCNPDRDRARANLIGRVHVS